MVALPFCSLTLIGKKPSRIPQNPKTIGDHIKKRRLELGLYQRQVAEVIGIDESTITNWEKNRTIPTLRCIPKIVEFLGYDPSPNDSNRLGGKLLRYRKSRGISQREFARQIGIDPTTLKRMESRDGHENRSVLKKVEAFLRVHVSGFAILGPP